jgi:hypothetical protein
VSVSSYDCVIWASNTFTIESLEFIIFTSNINATFSVWGWLLSWWADLALTINSQEFVGFADYLDAVETSALHEMWALSTLS